jgi:predicted RNA polymerase sigma factor
MTFTWACRAPPAAEDGAGGLLLLEEQDRGLWDQDQIRVGLAWLARSADGDTFSRYHAEAGIAAEHCLAPSFELTRWDRIVASYELLERQPRAIRDSRAQSRHRGRRVTGTSAADHVDGRCTVA